MYKIGESELKEIQKSLIDLVASLWQSKEESINDYDDEIREANRLIKFIDDNYLNIEH